MNVRFSFLIIQLQQIYFSLPLRVIFILKNKKNKTFSVISLSQKLDDDFNKNTVTKYLHIIFILYCSYNLHISDPH